MPGEFNNPANESAPSGAETNLNPGQIASARDHWVKAGLDGAKFDAAMGGVSDRAALSIEAAAPRPSGALTEDDFIRQSLPVDQAMQAAQALQRAGRSDDEIRRALEADGYRVEDAMLLPPEELAHDADWGVQPYSADDYRGIDYRSVIGPAIQQMDRTELHQFDQDARTLLSQVGIEPVLGRAVMERALAIRTQTSRMSQDQREAWVIGQQRQFLQFAGSPERAKELADLAGAALARAPRTELRDQLVRSGALNDAWVVRTLANYGAKMAGHAATKPKGR